MFTAKRQGRHTTAGTAYYWAFVALAISAVILAALDWGDLWWLALVGVGSYAFAAVGYLTGKVRGRPNWLIAHVSGQGGSYIAMVTALLVVNLGTDEALAWIVPTVIGTPIISYVNYGIATRRRPKSRPDLTTPPASRAARSALGRR